MKHRWGTGLRAVTAAVLVSAAACGGGGGGQDAARETTTTAAGRTTTSLATTTTRAGDGELAHSCSNPADGYSIRFPAGWYANDDEVTQPCRFFDTQPVTVEPNTEADEPVLLTVDPVDFERAAGGGMDEREVSRRSTEVDGHDALRMEVEATEGAPMRDAGDRSVRWLVRVADGETFVATARATDRVDLDAATDALDAMMQTLRFTDG